MYQFSETSKERLATCHPDLKKVFNLAIERTDIDFGIACGHRSVKEQQALYAKGRTEPGDIVTHVDGLNNKSEHNAYPSNAVDIYAWTGKASWDAKELCFLAGVVLSCAKELDIPIRWGGNWDSDGQIITDQNFIDLPHFELD